MGRSICDEKELKKRIKYVCRGLSKIPNVDVRFMSARIAHEQALLLFSGTFDMLTDTLIFVSWIFYAAGAYGVFVMRRKLPDAPRPYKGPGYPIVPCVFIVFALTFLGFTVYNDFVTYREAVAASKPSLINSVFGVALVLAGTPIYLFYRRRTPAFVAGDNER